MTCLSYAMSIIDLIMGGMLLYVTSYKPKDLPASPPIDPELVERQSRLAMSLVVAVLMVNAYVLILISRA